MFLSLFHATNDWLFSDVILLIVRLAGLANVVVSGEVPWGNTPATPLLAVKLALPPGTLKSTVLPKVLHHDYLINYNYR